MSVSPARLPRRLVARAWLVGIGTLVLVPACLVMSTPQIESPQPTAPFLVAATASPDPRKVLIIDVTDLEDKAGRSFKAHVVSEDASEDVRYALYTDYGYPDELYKRPYRAATPIFTSPAGSLNDKTRALLDVPWFPQQYGLGCHNVTLIASHEFDTNTQCPRCPSDASQITWQVYLCKPPNVPCDELNFEECQTWTKSCMPSATPDAGDQCKPEVTQ